MDDADKETRNDEVRLGGEARQLLDNELLRGALTAIEKKAEADWKTSAPGEVQEREAAWRMWRTTREFAVLLTRFVETGKLASEQLELDKSVEEPTQEFDSPNERRTGLHQS